MNRPVIMVILLLISACAYAEDTVTPLPPEAQKVVDKHDAGMEAAKKAYDIAVAKVKADAIKGLEPVVTKLTKAGNLEGALAVKAKIESLAPAVSTEKPRLILISVKYGVEGRTVDLTKHMKTKIVDGMLNFANDDSTNGALEDPAPGATKSFFITYTLDGKNQKTEAFPKHSAIKLGHE